MVGTTRHSGRQRGHHGDARATHKGGWELQFATNHLGHFALTTGLHDALKAAGQSRVVVVSSVGHVNGEVLLTTSTSHSTLRRVAAYSQSKTANILFAVEAASDGLVTGSPSMRSIRAHCGHQSEPPRGDTTGELRSEGQHRGIREEHRTGSATSVLLAASPLVAGVTGRYFEDSQEAVPFEPGVRRGVTEYALDPEKAQRLWQVSIDKITGAQ